ncbi:MAG: hypothetical protein A2583_15980 [Bdellovibrionales bacterium RIFOXYD1_FULL_53_11]|nr:MAG: hypothetical protein A2583_15980 [Bdellovibrionales bacterium RIFOXYD1_FULL_53_11]
MRNQKKPSFDDRQTILVVDDNHDLRETLCLFMESFYKVDAVATGAAAIEAINANHKYAVVVTDFALGGALDGLDVGLAVRKKSLTLPIVLITGSESTHPRILELLRLPQTKYLGKPFEFIELQRAVSAAMNTASI